jgi:heme oxygenase (biliverdin-IX-beta and delta-forming)
VQVPSRMLTRLNLATRVLHPEADALWVELLSPAPTVEKYGAALVTAYGFEAPVEAALSLTPGVNTAVPLRPRARTGLLVQDLLTLGFTASWIARLPLCCQIVPYRSTVEALGWLYVVERATLLHDTVRRHLEMAQPSLRAFSYLSAYDGHTGQRWVELGQALDHVAISEDIEEQIVAAARDAFAAQRDWFVTATETTESA